MRSALQRLAPFALFAVTAGCAAGAEERVETEGVDDVEASPLEITVERVEVVHGALRVRGEMADGSADVWWSLGDACDGREVGRGFATRASFTWMLDEGELADALACGLVVRARTRSGARRRIETAVLPVAASLSARVEGGEGPAGAPSYLDCARALLRGRPMALGEHSFDVSVAVNDVALEADSASEGVDVEGDVVEVQSNSLTAL